MKETDYCQGEKLVPLTKKNVDFYCNKIMAYAHDGFSLEYFLFDWQIRKSSWDKFVKKHKKIQQAIEDARYRAKGKAYGMVFKRMQTDLTPTLFKAFADASLGWKSEGAAGLEDLPPAVIEFVLQNPAKPVATHKDKKPSNVQATGHSGGNGKGGNGKG